MRIGIVLSKTPAYSETFFQCKIKGLQENGFDVTVFCQKANKDFTLCPVIERPEIIGNKILQSWYFLIEFILLLPYSTTVGKYIKQERQEGTEWDTLLKKIYLNAHILKSRVDWLHFGFATLALGRETVAEAIGARMAVSFRGFDIAVYPIRHPDCYSLLWRYVDKVHVISEDIKALAYEYGLPKDVKIQKITPAIDFEFFSTASKDTPTDDLPIFMTTGRLHWKKGYEQTLEAFAILKNEGINFIYNIVGKGDEYERIAFTAYQLGLKENVQFLGKLTPSQVKKELDKTHIYLQYSLQEGFCNSVLEAQAMGKLCVVSDAEGLSENVIHGKTGWVVPKNSPQLLAEQIKEVLFMENPQKEEISKTARERVRRDFDLNKQTRELLEFYDLEVRGER